MRGGF